MSRILVTGNRDWTSLATISKALSEYPRDFVVVHGDCWRGADALADMAARELGFRVERHPAEWREHGRAAGPFRNSHMVSLGADVCLAFGDLERDGHRTGTGDCVAKARRAGIPVRHWETAR